MLPLSPKGKTGYLFYSDILGFSKNTVPISNRKLVKALTQSEIWGFLPYRAHQNWRFSSRFQQSPLAVTLWEVAHWGISPCVLEMASSLPPLQKKKKKTIEKLVGSHSAFLGIPLQFGWTLGSSSPSKGWHCILHLETWSVELTVSCSRDGSSMCCISLS